MAIDRAFVVQEECFVGAMRNRHNVDVPKFGAGFTPVTVRQNVVTAHFPAGFRLAPRRHGPVEKRVETRDANPGRGRLHVLEERGKSSDDFPRVQRLGDPAKLVQVQASLRGASAPRRGRNFADLEFPFESDQNFPFQLAQLRGVHRRHRRRHLGFAPGLDRFPPHMSNAQGKNSFRGH